MFRNASAVDLFIPEGFSTRNNSKLRDVLNVYVKILTIANLMGIFVLCFYCCIIYYLYEVMDLIHMSGCTAIVSVLHIFLGMNLESQFYSHYGYYDSFTI